MDFKKAISVIMTTAALAIIVWALLSPKAHADEWRASDTIREAGIGTYADNDEYEHTEFERDDTEDSTGTTFFYINGRQCFRMESASGVIITCND